MAFRQNTVSIREAWPQYKMLVLKSMLGFAAVVLVLAQFVPAVARVLLDQKYLSIAAALALVLVLLDTVLSPPSKPEALASRFPPVLEHTGDLSGLFPALLKERRVKIALASYSSETFYSVLTGFLDQVAAGKTDVRELDVRLLVPDCQTPMGIPCLIDSRRESPAYKRLLVQRSGRFIREFENAINRIATQQKGVNAVFEARVHRLSPLFKLVILQDEVAYCGTYPIDRTPVHIGNREQMFFDYRGERVTLARCEASSSLVNEATTFKGYSEWFESVWELAAGTSEADDR